MPDEESIRDLIRKFSEGEDNWGRPEDCDGYWRALQAGYFFTSIARRVHLSKGPRSLKTEVYKRAHRVSRAWNEKANELREESIHGVNG